MEYTMQEVTAIHVKLDDGFCLTGIPNINNPKRSWWLSKDYCMKGIYCFSTFSYGTQMKRELEDQLTVIQQYIDLFYAKTKED